MSDEEYGARIYKVARRENRLFTEEEITFIQSCRYQFYSSILRKAQLLYDDATFDRSLDYLSEPYNLGRFKELDYEAMKFMVEIAREIDTGFSSKNPDITPTFAESTATVHRTMYNLCILNAGDIEFEKMFLDAFNKPKGHHQITENISSSLIDILNNRDKFRHLNILGISRSQGFKIREEGVLDYLIETNSSRLPEVLLNLSVSTDPHDRFRLFEAMEERERKITMLFDACSKVVNKIKKDPSYDDLKYIIRTIYEWHKEQDLEKVNESVDFSNREVSKIIEKQKELAEALRKAEENAAKSQERVNQVSEYWDEKLNLIP